MACRSLHVITFEFNISTNLSRPDKQRQSRDQNLPRSTGGLAGKETLVPVQKGCGVKQVQPERDKSAQKKGFDQKVSMLYE